MFKRMADRITVHLPRQHKDPQLDIADLSSYLPPSPVSAVSPQFEHRGSISTERTSSSEWSKRGDSLDYPESVKKRLPSRPKGSYKLDDFIIQRTLGTGSFGRVHLGKDYPMASSDMPYTPQSAVNTTSVSMLSKY